MPRPRLRKFRTGPKRVRPSKGWRKHLMREKADLRLTGSGVLTREPEQPFVLAPAKRKTSKKARTEQLREAEEYRKEKMGKRIRSGGKRGKRGGMPKREPRKEKGARTVKKK